MAVNIRDVGYDVWVKWMFSILMTDARYPLAVGETGDGGDLLLFATKAREEEGKAGSGVAGGYDRIEDLFQLQHRLDISKDFPSLS